MKWQILVISLLISSVGLAQYRNFDAQFESEAALLDLMKNDNLLEYKIDKIVEVLSAPEAGDWLQARRSLMQIVRSNPTMTEPPLKLLALFESPYLSNAEGSLLELLRYLPKQHDAKVARLLFQQHGKRWNKVVRTLIKRRDNEAMEILSTLHEESRGLWPWDKSLNEALKLYQVRRADGFIRPYEPMLGNALSKPQMSCGKLF